MAEKLQHRSHTTVQGWWDRGIIPAQRQREVLDAANTHGVQIEAGDLIPPAQGIVEADFVHDGSDTATGATAAAGKSPGLTAQVLA
jgi:hypothetical protein